MPSFSTNVFSQFVLVLWPSLYFLCIFFFFFNDTATTEIYTLSLHDALPISFLERIGSDQRAADLPGDADDRRRVHHRSEEHTSELQSQSNLVCRLLLEKKKKKKTKTIHTKKH